ncbi:MAG TPA: hypothetical protein VNR65_02330 [Geobacterales bacterium]|nr:hypothetical protein [Geobacterales bacterium]
MSEIPAPISDTRTAYSPAAHNAARVSRVRLFIRALGVSFFSVLSVLIAFYAFYELPQVQDLLFDARPYWIQEAIYWAGFYAIGIFIWALPLVFSARLLLLQNFDVIGIDTEERFKFYIFRFPSFFVVLTFVAVLVGVIAAADNLPVPLLNGGNKYEAPIRSLVETHLLTLLIATAGVLVLVVFRGMFLRGYGRSMKRLEDTDPKGFKKSLIQIEELSRKSDRNLEECDLHLTALKPEFLSTETWLAAQRVKGFMWRYMVRLTWFLLLLVAIHFLSYSEMVQRLISLPDAYFNSQVLDLLSDTFSMKRASFLFIVFGAWIPFVTILSLLSNRYQFPFISGLAAVVVGLTLFVGDGHDIRVVTISNDQQPSLRPIGFSHAVKDWKTSSGWDAKGCEWLAPDANALANCPRPIIVAGEGGGSRAAFLLASVLGSLEDDSLDKSKHPSARPFHEQLFAISSVSGSSVGATFFVGALKARPNTTTEDLKNALFRQRLWFPNVASANPEKANENVPTGQTITREFLTDYVSHKDALQAALSNDFISPVAISYLARDVLMLSRFPFVEDRAGILEISWEDAFNGIYGTTRETSPLSAPLQTIAPAPGGWTPLLFLNATSNETGRRIIVTPVKMTEPTSTGNALFVDAYDLHELLCSPYRDPKTNAVPELSTWDRIARILPYRFSPVAHAKCDNKKPTSIDIRFSTAAGASSRSPFVSPHGNVRDRRAQIADSVVDGGYFDNSGIVTALEIAQGLKSVDARLRPFILQVSSEPDWFKDNKNCGIDGSYGDRPKIPDQADFRPLGTLADVLTVNSTRVARGYETILELPDRAKQLNGGLRSVAQINVCPQPKESFFLKAIQPYTGTDNAAKEQTRALHIRRKAQEEVQYKSVSLSWWLSPPLQAFLDAQIYSEHNQTERNCVISLLEDKPNQPCR